MNSGHLKLLLLKRVQNFQDYLKILNKRQNENISLLKTLVTYYKIKSLVYFIVIGSAANWPSSVLWWWWCHHSDPSPLCIQLLYGKILLMVCLRGNKSISRSPQTDRKHLYVLGRLPPLFLICNSPRFLQEKRVSVASKPWVEFKFKTSCLSKFLFSLLCLASCCIRYR